MGRNVQVVLKCGGAAITFKDQFETLNEDVLNQLTDLILTLVSRDICHIVVHGAGSFGHFQAAESGLAQGGSRVQNHHNRALAFAQTRVSVSKLNSMFVQALVAKGVPAVGVSPMSSWTCRGRHTITVDGCAHIQMLLDQGLVPVIHGDAVIDEELNYTILGGDPIMTRLCEHFKPQRAIFMTNVEGIYDRPPTQDGAQLIRQINVHDGSGKWTGLTAERQEITNFDASTADHDTTGGIAGKLEEAIKAAKITRVFIVRASNNFNAIAACSMEALPWEWRGTEVFYETLECQNANQ